MTTHPNDPSLWKERLPKTVSDGHKYDRGVAVIYGAAKMTGATRLAAEACARMGAGLVRVVAPTGTGDVYRASLPAHIIIDDEAPEQLEAGKHFADARCRSVLLGPGCMPDASFKMIFQAAVKTAHVKGLVLDAGAFTSWAGHVDEFRMLSDPLRVAVTPHEGEFEKLFGPVSKAGKQTASERAARNLGATVVLKGAQTIIASPGQTIVNDRDVPELSTAGTGDVLAGMIAGLAAQGMDVSMASAAAVWLHAEAAARFGRGLVASDLPLAAAHVLRELSAP